MNPQKLGSATANNPRKRTHQLDVEVEDAFKKSIPYVEGLKAVSNNFRSTLEVTISNSYGGYNF
jgi:hypothetical protein